MQKNLHLKKRCHKEYNMKKVFSIFILLTLTTILNASMLKYASSYEEAIALGKKENKNILLYTYSEYCPWCTKMQKTTFKNEKVINYINKNYILAKVDINNDTFPLRFKPNGVPTTYIINSITENKLISMRGYKSPKSFYNRIKE